MKHDDTSVALHPLRFRDALKKLTQASKPASPRTKKAALDAGIIDGLPA